MPTIIVTIDGPSASGKSSVSREIARRHGWKWVSTGAFYRGLALLAQKAGTPLNDEKALVELSRSARWTVKLEDSRTLVLIDGEDLTDQINGEKAGSAASQISQLQGVRRSLLAAQRNCASGVKGLIAEGRDCGTVVFPEAPFKFYLTAKSESRAARRAVEEGASVQETKAAQRTRDAQDRNRQAAPLQIPENAIVVDTSEMTLSEVVEEVDRHLREGLSKGT